MEIVTNQLMLTGVVTEEPQFDHEVFGEAFFHTILSVPRLSGAYDLLPLTVSERLMAEGFRQGETASISGQLRSYNKVMGGQGRLLLTAFAQRLRPVDEEENPNTVFLTGALCKPPSFRTTPFGREIADLMLAVNRSYGKSDYIPCIAWGRTARFASGLSVGDRIQLQGRFQSRAYQKQLPDGTVQERTAYEVSVSRLTLETSAGGLPEHEAPSRPRYTSGVIQ